MARRIQVEIVGDSRSVERAFKRAGGAATGFRRTIGTLGKVAAGGLAGGFVAAGLAIRAGFKELAEAQKVAAQTNAVIRSTGGAANVTAKHVEKLSSSLSRMSGIDDEAIAAGQNMLMTFTNIRNGARKNEKVFDAATKTILDMSVALGRDLPDVAIMVGKALNDLEVNQKGTITGWSALRRVGVKVTADMMKQAVAFIKAGEPMKAQMLLLKELNMEFGGSAQAFGSTMPGALGKLRNAFDELMAAFAQGFLPLILKVANALTTKLADPAFVARVTELGNVIGTKLLNAFMRLSQWFQDNWGNIQAGLRVTRQILNTTVGAIKAVTEAFQGLSSIGSAALRAMLLPARMVLAMWSGILTLASKIPFIGGKFEGALDAVNAARETIASVDTALAGGGAQKTKKGGTQGKKRRAGVAAATGIIPGQGRALGGPVWPGVAYRVGERGPETFIPGVSGSIASMGGGGTTVVDVYLDGRKVARAVAPHLHRTSKQANSQGRGRFPGVKPAY